MKRNARMKQRQEFIIALAMLKGAEIEEMFTFQRSKDVLWHVHDADGSNAESSFDRSLACERWLIQHGIVVGPNCEVADLSTRIEA